MRCLVGFKDLWTGAPVPVPCEGLLRELERLDRLRKVARWTVPGMWRENGICLEEVTPA